jgi:prophage maintenance system killer protein/phage regulator Rha-like protein
MEIEIYKTKENTTEVRVLFQKETVWLNQAQLAELFEKDRTVVSKHIRNIFKEGELEEKVVCAKFAHTTQHGAVKGKTQEAISNYYNLDVIISVGYRVKSIRATQFRQWATQRLKDYLVQGYAINERRLKETENKFQELKQAVKLLESIVQTKEITGDEAQGLLKVLSDYAFALDILDQYDHQTLKIAETDTDEVYKISYSEAIKAIAGLKTKFGGSNLFGNEKDDSFKSSLATIYQTYDGIDLYPSVQEKAGHLLYFVTKNHSFSDGNKRIAAFLFVWFLERNALLYYEGKKVIDDNALVALTLMIAESKPDDKDMMVKVIINLINNR